MTDSGASESIQRASTAEAADQGYPHGHLGHLDAAQAEQLEEFRKLVAEAGLYKAGPPPSHEDEALLYVRPPRPRCPLRPEGEGRPWERPMEVQRLTDGSQEVFARAEVGACGRAAAVQGHARVARGQRH